MSSKSKKNRRNQPFGLPASTSPSATTAGGGTPSGTRSAPNLQRTQSYRNFLRILFVVIVFGGGSLALAIRGGWLFTQVPRYTYRVIEKFPHDPLAFTQGLIIDETGEYFYESTGRVGQSTFRKVQKSTGEVLRSVPIDSRWFGEGLVKLNGKFYQLTWQNEKILTYDADMNLLETRDFPEEMWGLTTDGKSLIISNGTSRLLFVNPDTLQVTKTINARIERGLVRDLNELEFYNNKIYANKYQYDLIYEIDATDGQVTAMIDLTGLWPTAERPVDGVLNGIAINPETGQIFVTGKLCPFIYEVKFDFRD